MSVLLFRLPFELGEIVAARLLAQDDEVRVLIQPGDRDEDLRDLGVHIASGPFLDDDDLWERAFQNVRTVVAGSEIPQPATPIMDALVRGATAAGVTRAVYAAPVPDTAVVEALRTSGLEYAVLETGTRGLLQRSAAIDDQDVAEAIDAADDLAGTVKLELNLTQPDSWTALKLEPKVG